MKRIDFIFGFVVLACLGCQEPSGVGLAAVHVEAMKSDGTPVSGFESDNCTIMPILLGSRIERRLEIETPLEVVIDVTRDQAEISFRGASGSAPSRVIGEASLRSGFSEELAVDGPNGAYRVVITSSCPVKPTK